MEYLLNVQLVIEQGMKNDECRNDEYLFVSSWKDPNCSFRTDSKLRLSNIPTLIEWGTVSNDR
jgi:hypothetical protein